jgi:hypothetical protein
MINFNLVELNLISVLSEIEAQPEVGAMFSPELQSYSDQITQLREYIEDAGEYGVAYESLVSMLEAFPFKVTGPSVVKLLEVALLLGFKTDRAEDAQFDRR